MHIHDYGPYEPISWKSPAPKRRSKIKEGVTEQKVKQVTSRMKKSVPTNIEWKTPAPRRKKSRVEEPSTAHLKESSLIRSKNRESSLQRSSSTSQIEKPKEKPPRTFSVPIPKKPPIISAAAEKIIEKLNERIKHLAEKLEVDPHQVAVLEDLTRDIETMSREMQNELKESTRQFLKGQISKYQSMYEDRKQKYDKNPKEIRLLKDLYDYREILRKNNQNKLSSEEIKNLKKRCKL